MNTLQQVRSTADFLLKFAIPVPKVGIILGTGLSGFEKEMKVRSAVPYTDIPGFPAATVEGHPGNLLFGDINETPVMAMQGRFHYYEGHRMDEIIFPVRVMKFLGIEYLFVSNASGGMDPAFKVGDVMAITDHINCMPNPLVGPHEPAYGPRFPDLGKAYDRHLIDAAMKVASENNIKLHTGCYVAVTGPTFETPKEYAYYRKMGGDNIGMSTVPEVIAAVQMGIKCFAISVITDLGIEGHVEKISHEEVQQAANSATWKLSSIIKGLVDFVSSGE